MYHHFFGHKMPVESLNQIRYPMPLAAVWSSGQLTTQLSFRRAYLVNQHPLQSNLNMYFMLLSKAKCTVCITVPTYIYLQYLLSIIGYMTENRTLRVTCFQNSICGSVTRLGNLLPFKRLLNIWVIFEYKSCNFSSETCLVNFWAAFSLG